MNKPPVNSLEVIKLKEAVLNDASKGEILDLVFKLEEADRRRRRILNIVQEALAQLRLDMKYILFDRDCLKSELESKS